MIIFTTNPNIVNVVARFIASTGYTDYVKGFNLTSYINIFPTLNNLSPDDTKIGLTYDNPGFDVAYAGYIHNSIEALADLNSIIDPIYTHGGISIVTIDNSSDYRSIINETVANAIYYRYGYKVTFAETEEDLLFAERPSFTMQGLQILQKDVMLLGSMVMSTMTQEEMDDIAEGTEC